MNPVRQIAIACAHASIVSSHVMADVKPGPEERIVAPDSTEEVQAAVRAVNLYRIPIVKDAVDPNGIFSPGRYGIWPKHLQGNRK